MKLKKNNGSNDLIEIALLKTVRLTLTIAMIR